MKKITSIGEILFDVYPEGKNMGGAPFNFIYHIIKLTGTGNFISRIGNDDLGKEINDFLKTNNISNQYIQVDDEHATGVANTVLDENKVPDFKIESNRAYDFIELTNDVNSLVANSTECLYFGTLAQRELKSRKTIQSLFENNIKFFCDLNIRQKFFTKEVIEASLKAAHVLKLNLDEMQLINELLFNENFNKEKIARKIIDDYEVELLCVTQGSDGAILFDKNRLSSFKTKTENIVDTVGAGDAFASILCLGFLKGMDIDLINKTASEFAAEIVKVEGALPKDDSIYEKFKGELDNA